MTTITTINPGDLITDSRSDINTNFANLNTDKIETSYIDTDNTLAANSDSKLATQKAVKAYVLATANPTGASWNEYAVDAVGTDSYAITVSTATSYTSGQTFKFKVATANTGACTLNVNGLGAKTIKKNKGSDLATGDLVAGQVVEVVYDGTNMQMTSPFIVLKNKIGIDTTTKTTQTSGTMYTVAVLGGTLGTNNAIRITVLNPQIQLGTTGDVTLTFNYGGQSAGAAVLGTSSSQSGSRDCMVYSYITASGATNTQKGFSTAVQHPLQTSSTSTDIVNYSTSMTVDSTADQNITVVLTTSGGSNFSCSGIIVELIS